MMGVKGPIHYNLRVFLWRFKNVYKAHKSRLDNGTPGLNLGGSLPHILSTYTLFIKHTFNSTGTPLFTLYDIFSPMLLNR